MALATISCDRRAVPMGGQNFLGGSVHCRSDPDKHPRLEFDATQ
jgi:hypothetical protein